MLPLYEAEDLPERRAVQVELAVDRRASRQEPAELLFEVWRKVLPPRLLRIMSSALTMQRSPSSFG
jgi:hypothetical protein